MRELTPLFEKWCNQYLDNPEGMKSYLSSPHSWGDVARQIGSDVYHYYAGTKQIERIENRSEEEKRRLWKTAKGAGLDSEQSKRLAKTWYLFENVLQQEVK